MKFINSFDVLLDVIENDRTKFDRSSGRYSTRVIFLDNFTLFKELISSLNLKRIDLSNLLPSPTKWFTSDELIKLIQDCDESCVIYPLSEILRFYTDRQLQSFLTSVFETQNNENKSKRVYIPLVGLYEKFSEEFWNKFHRQKEGAPVWRFSSFDNQNKVKIFKLNTEISTNIKLISNNVEWLNYWKSEIITPVINTSSSLNKRWDNFLSDDCFESRILNNIADFINEIYSLNIKYEFWEHENDYWKQLLSLYEKNVSNNTISFIQLLHTYFNINKFASLSLENLFILYLESEKFGKWLLKLYLNSADFQKSYLKNVISECSEYSIIEVIEKLYLDIFNIESDKDNLIVQREKLIDCIYLDYESDINKIILSFMSKISSSESKDSIKYITGHTFEEKKFVFNLIQKTTEEKEKKQIINTKLISLTKYLDWSVVKYQFNSVEKWIIEYFELYNKSKFENQSSEHYERIFNYLNEDSDNFFKWYYSTDELPKIDDKTIVQVDALSVEWLPYIIHIVQKYGKEYNKKISDITIHRSNLPTITKFNKLSNAEYIQDLDLLLHTSTGYKFPDTLIKQLELVKTIVINVLKKPEPYIYLTADHGATCHCMKQFGRIKKYDFENHEHEGRYLYNSNNMEENESFIKSDNYFIGLKHDSLNSLPKREVHGGASPEEVLIPLIEIEQIDNQILHNFEIVEEIIDYNYKKLLVKIYPKPKKNPVVFINASIYESSLQKNLYTFDISDLLPNKYKAKCVSSDQEFNFTFEISGGIKEEDLF